MCTPYAQHIWQPSPLTCEVLDAGAAAAPVLKAHSIAHLPTQLTPALLSNSSRNSHSTLHIQATNHQWAVLQDTCAAQCC
jgi:hypothetical protein